MPFCFQMVIRSKILKISPQLQFVTINFLLPQKYMLFRNFQHCEFSQVLTLNSKSSNKPPKRPVHFFLPFSGRVLPEISKKYPKSTNDEFVNVATDLWSSLDRKQKKKLHDSYYEDLEKYHFTCLEYECKLNEENDSKKISKKEKRKLSGLRVLSGKPKRPPTAFFLFLKTQRDSKPEKLSIFQWNKECGVKYRNLTDEEKAAFRKTSKELSDAYKKALYEWEDRVTKLGCLEILTKDSQFSKHFTQDDSS